VVGLAGGEGAPGVEAGGGGAQQALQAAQDPPPSRRVPLLQLRHLLVQEVFCRQELRLPLHCKENSIYVFLFWELRGLSPNFYIRVSVSDFIYSQDWSTYFPAGE
jgi:hypothetical protein